MTPNRFRFMQKYRLARYMAGCYEGEDLLRRLEQKGFERVDVGVATMGWGDHPAYNSAANALRSPVGATLSLVLALVFGLVGFIAQETPIWWTIVYFASGFLFPAIQVLLYKYKTGVKLWGISVKPDGTVRAFAKMRDQNCNHIRDVIFVSSEDDILNIPYQE